MATYVTQCEFCRRVTDARRGAGPDTLWQEAAQFAHSRHLQLSDLVVHKAYCSECARFYEQLVTFGRGEPLPFDWSPTETSSSTAAKPAR